ncbi:MAG: cell division protein FtsZ [Xanthobacteraceae bacterium]|nr:cell division protein FtsZ [Xanthobacteraceae bacterium]
MTINLQMPDIRELKPHITVFGVGGAGGNAVNNMIAAGLQGCEFVVANTDAQALKSSKCARVIQMGLDGLGAGSHPEVGKSAAEEAMAEVRDMLQGVHMVFVTAGMGGGTGTGAAPVIARVAKDLGILTVGVVTKPFDFEGGRRMKLANAGVEELAKHVDTLIVIPNQNLFRVANKETTFADAFAMADQVLYSGVACITDLMVKEGLINLDFADVRTVMREMGKAMMGTGEASGDDRALRAAENAINNPLLDETSMRGAKGLLISITGGRDLKLHEVDEAATRIRDEVDTDANIILGATFDESLEGIVRVSVVATGIDGSAIGTAAPEIRPAFSNHNRPSPSPQARATNFTADVPHIPLSMQPELPQGEYYEEHYEDDYAPEAAEIDEVTIRPLEQRPAFFQPLLDEMERLSPKHEEPEDLDPYVPEQAERPPFRPRMPRIDEFPMPAQNQMRARNGEMADDHSVEKRQMSLLEKLASSFNRKEPEEAAPVAARRAPEPMPEAPRRPEGRNLLDPVSRPARADSQDELEIPAFLRRQA